MRGCWTVDKRHAYSINVSENGFHLKKEFSVDTLSVGAESVATMEVHLGFDGSENMDQPVECTC
jgi:hypothetical protein